MEAPHGEDRVGSYFKKIRERLKSAYNAKEPKMKQEEIAAACKLRGINATQGTISRALAVSDETIPLLTVLALCDILEIDMSELLSLRGLNAMEDPDPDAIMPRAQDEPPPRGADETKPVVTAPAHAQDAPPPPRDAGAKEPSGPAYDHEKDAILASDTLITDPNHKVFRGYYGITLNAYFYPTISFQSELLHGTLKFMKDNKNKTCSVEFVIHISPTETKTYHGVMRISLLQDACYIILSNSELSEISTIFFSYRFFSASSLKAALAMCSTISAGHSLRPTAHRMALVESGKALTEDDMTLIKAQLLQNDRQIRVTRKAMEKLAQGGSPIFQDIMKRAIAEEPVMVYEESDILKMPGYNYYETTQALCKLRLAADAPKYNKSSRKSDDMLYKRLFVQRLSTDT